MATFSVTGNDTLTLFDRTFVDFADGDNTTVAFPNELVTVKTGKNGNTIYAKNETGNNADVMLRVIRGSADDRFLQGKLTEQQNDFPAFVLGQGEFVKRTGDGEGNVANDIYNLQGGVFVRKVDGKENVEGDTEQSVSIYMMKFALATRSIG